MSGLMKGVRHLTNAVTKFSPYILTGTAIVGVGTTAALAVKATPGAMEDLAKATEQKQIETENPEARLTKVEAIKVAGPHYIPAGISGVLTSGCMLMSTHISMKRAAGCAALAASAQQALNEYSDKVSEKFGKEKEKEVRDEIAVDKMKKNPPTKGCVIETGDGDQLFFFVPHNVWFRSSMEAVRKKLNDFNAEIVLCGGRSENDLIDSLYKGMDRYGEMYGFPPPYYDEKTGIKRSLVEFNYTSYLDEDGNPNLDYQPRYILNGEAATAIDYEPWSGPEVNWER